MIEKAAFAKNFPGFIIPQELADLLAFENSIFPGESFSEGFSLMVDEEKHGLKTYSTEAAFLNSILEFAFADGTGSTYGYWLRDNSMDLNDAPVIISGSEGGIHIVAENIIGLMRILTYDAEAIVDWKNVFYFKTADDHVPSQKLNDFKKFCLENFNVTATANPAEIISKAQQKYGEAFRLWLSGYYSA